MMHEAMTSESRSVKKLSSLAAMRAVENSLSYTFGAPLTQWQEHPVCNYSYAKGMTRFMDAGVLKAVQADGSFAAELQANFPFARTLKIVCDMASPNVAFISFLSAKHFYVAWEFDCCHR